jgi:hypothetical protein
MTSIRLTDSIDLALGDHSLPTWFHPAPPRDAPAFTGRGQHFTSVALRDRGFPRVSVALDSSIGIRCIVVERMQGMQASGDSLAQLFGRAPAQQFTTTISEERVWWGPDSRVALWGYPPKADPRRLGVSIVIVALIRGEPIDTVRGPVC